MRVEIDAGLDGSGRRTNGVKMGSDPGNADFAVKPTLGAVWTA